VSILRVPRSIVHFIEAFCPRSSTAEFLPGQIRNAIPGFLSAICLGTGRRTQKLLAGFVSEDQRDPGTVSRMFRDRRFRSRDLFRTAFREAVERCLPLAGDPEVKWHLSLDGTSLSRGLHTRIPGANSFSRKEKLPERAGTRGKLKRKSRRSGKVFTILLGNVTTHEGIRIPIPRRTCDPRKFNRVGRPCKQRPTQLDLACLAISELEELLPENVRLVVTADNLFEGKKLWKLARELGFVFITTVDSRRCFAHPGTTTTNGEPIQKTGRDLPWKAFQRLDLRRGEEKTVSFRRHGARTVGPKDRRIYWVRHEKRDVAGLGEVAVVFSWRSPVYRPRRNFRKRTFKALLCSDPAMSEELVVEFYEARWTNIEILIRELKQDLGFGSYMGSSIEAMERFLDLVLLGFLYLEMLRLDLLEDNRQEPKVQEKLRAARTRGIIETVRREHQAALWAHIVRAADSPTVKRRLKRFFTSTLASPAPQPCVRIA
jgi:hypothetical protein